MDIYHLLPRATWRWSCSILSVAETAEADYLLVADQYKAYTFAHRIQWQELRPTARATGMLAKASGEASSDEGAHQPNRHSDWGPPDRGRGPA